MPNSVRSRKKRRTLSREIRPTRRSRLITGSCKQVVAFHLLHGFPKLGIGCDGRQARHRLHDVLGGDEAPLELRDGGDILQSQHATRLAGGVIDHKEVVLTVGEHSLLDDLVQGHQAGHFGVVLRHGLTDCQTAQLLLDIHLGAGRGRGALQEPADEGQPQTVGDLPAEEAEDAQGDEGEGDQLTADRGDAGGALVFPGQLPDDGPQHTPAIERKAGDQVEESQDEVDFHQIEGRSSQDRELLPEEVDGAEKAGEGEADDRAGNGNAELRARGLGLTGNLGDAAEGEQSDALDGDMVAHGDDRMTQLVQHD